MDFPHLNDTNFPNVNGVNVYKYENTFDYSRWQGKTAIKLMNVLWNSNYADVPYFENNVKRDEWFDEQPGIVRPLESAFIVTPDNSVKIPIPYNDAFNYNYLVVDVPIMTSEEQPIDYETTNRIKRWYYFIDDMSQRSPSTTEVFITCDYWTTFIHSVEIPYLMLERGHAPMFQTNVNTFLANPIANNEYLLADDFNFGGTQNIVSETKYYPIGNGKKYVCFALPISPSNIANLGGADYSGNSSAPTFSNTADRWGYQLEVNGYAWHYGKGDYSNAKLPIDAFCNNESNIFNGNYIYAIDSVNASAFFNKLANNAVHVLNAIEAVFVLASDLITLGASYNLQGYTIYRCTKNNTNINITLSKTDFGFDEKYSDITKLYTYPYSRIEITDDNGFNSEIRVENCGSIKLYKEISNMFPYLQYQCFFTGIDGNTTQNYIWYNVNDTTDSKTMWEDDFSKMMMKWDIPTFAVKVSQEQIYNANNFAAIQAERDQAVIDYQNMARLANTTRENVADSMATQTTNVANIGSNSVTNQGVQNNANSTITARDNTCSTEVTENNVNLLWDNTADANTKLNDDAGSDIGASVMANLANNDAIGLSAANNISANAQGAALNYTNQLGAAIAGGITGGPAGVAQSGYPAMGIASVIAAQHIYSSHANCASIISQSNNNAVTTAAATATTDKAIHALSNNINMTLNSQVNAYGNLAETTSCHTDNTNTSNTAHMTMTTNTANTNNTNAVNTQNTETNNATWNRNAMIVNGQETLRQKQRNVAARYKSNELQAPYFETQNADDAYPDVFQRRGIRFNIRTQTKSAISQVGDAFLRFGYALHRNWDMSNGFNYGKHFTFWKAEDIWINNSGECTNIAVRIIGDILLKGVTVWKNPNEIGKIGIYNNM